MICVSYGFTILIMLFLHDSLLGAPVEEKNVVMFQGQSLRNRLIQKERKWKPNFLKYAQSMNLTDLQLNQGDEACLKDINMYLLQLDKYSNSWASKVFRAHGDRANPRGSYTTCQEADEMSNIMHRVSLDGYKFCIYRVFSGQPFGVCVPRSCSVQTLQSIVEKGSEVNVQNIECEEDIFFQTPPENYNTIVTMFLGTIALLNILGTIYMAKIHIRLIIMAARTHNVFIHLCQRLGIIKKLCVPPCCGLCTQLQPSEIYFQLDPLNNNKYNEDIKTENLTQRILACFGLKQNICALVECVPSAESTISTLPGIRCFAMCIIVFFHTYYYQSLTMEPNKPYSDFMQSYKTIIAASNMSVEAFFVMGGMLAFQQSVRFFGSRSRTTCAHVIKLYIKRIWRLSPAYFSIILIHGAVVSRNKSNPWFHSKHVFEMCERSLPYQLTYTFNLKFMDEGLGGYHCLPHTWYISADMQLFLTIPIFVILWKRKKLFGFCAIISAMLFTLIGVTSLVDYKETHPYNTVWTLYGLPTHVNSYFGGVLLGMVLAMDTRDIKSRGIARRNWCFLVVCFVLCCMVIIAGTTGHYTVILQSAGPMIIHAISASYRNCFAYLVAFIIFICMYNKNIVGIILSSPFWQPLAKLSYSIYIISCGLQRYYFESEESKTAWRYENMFLLTGGFIVVSTLSACFNWILIEKPCENMGIIFFQKKRESLSVH